MDTTPFASARLTVRPQRMATGTRTSRAGLQELPGFPGYLLYVPISCVGSTRSPLIVLLHGGGRSAALESVKFQALADQYRVIVLLPNATQPGRWEMAVDAYYASSPTPAGLQVTHFPTQDVRRIDAALQYVLRTAAIQPNRIALLGFSDGGSSALLLGRSNQDVFSRVAALSALSPFAGTGPINPTTQFLLSGGIGEDMVSQTMIMARILRHEGHPVVTLLGLRGHVDQVADEAFVWRWLVQSWADPTITQHPPMPTDSDPMLTVAVLQRMQTFWTQFKQEPDAVFLTDRLAHQVQQWMWVGAEPVSVITTDMGALAKVSPSVAAELRVAGLTAAQEMAYHRALVRMAFVRAAQKLVVDDRATGLGAGLSVPPIASTSVLGKNLAFWLAHEAEFLVLRRAVLTIQ